MNVAPFFGLTVLGSFVAWGVVAMLYVWPKVRSMPAKDALMALAAPHMFRFEGLAFLIPGVVSAALPQGFGREVGLGDMIAAILAIGTVLALAADAPWALALVWVFNLWGTADLLNALIQGPIQLAGPTAGALGAGFWIPTFLVPGLLWCHAMSFRLLTKRATVENAVTT
jgi:hypothetical protein